MKLLPKRIGKNMPYYDSRTSRELKIIKSVDITDECPSRKMTTGKKERVILDFTQATEGIMVNVISCNPGKDHGSSVGNFMHHLEPLDEDKASTLLYFAKRFGLSSEQFIQILQREAPATDIKKQRNDLRAFAPGLSLKAAKNRMLQFGFSIAGIKV